MIAYYLLETDSGTHAMPERIEKREDHKGRIYAVRVLTHAGGLEIPIDPADCDEVTHGRMRRVNRVPVSGRRS